MLNKDSSHGINGSFFEKTAKNKNFYRSSPVVKRFLGFSIYEGSSKEKNKIKIF